MWVDNVGQLYSQIRIERPLRKRDQPPSLKHLARLAIHKAIQSSGKPRIAFLVPPHKQLNELPNSLIDYLGEYQHTIWWSTSQSARSPKTVFRYLYIPRGERYYWTTKVLLKEIKYYCIRTCEGRNRLESGLGFPRQIYGARHRLILDRITNFRCNFCLLIGVPPFFSTGERISHLE